MTLARTSATFKTEGSSIKVLEPAYPKIVQLTDLTANESLRITTNACILHRTEKKVGADTKVAFNLASGATSVRPEPPSGSSPSGQPAINLLSDESLARSAAGEAITKCGTPQDPVGAAIILRKDKHGKEKLDLRLWSGQPIPGTGGDGDADWFAALSPSIDRGGLAGASAVACLAARNVFPSIRVVREIEGTPSCLEKLAKGQGSIWKWGNAFAVPTECGGAGWFGLVEEMRKGAARKDPDAQFKPNAGKKADTSTHRAGGSMSLVDILVRRFESLKSKKTTLQAIEFGAMCKE